MEDNFSKMQSDFVNNMGGFSTAIKTAQQNLAEFNMIQKQTTDYAKEASAARRSSKDAYTKHLVDISASLSNISTSIQKLHELQSQQTTAIRGSLLERDGMVIRFKKALSDELAPLVSSIGGPGLLSKGIRGAVSTILHAIPGLSGAAYKHELPKANRVGAMGATVQTLGMIYVHGRIAADENNKLLYQISQLLNAGFGLGVTLYKPKGRGLAGIIGTTIKQTIEKLPFFKKMQELSTRIEEEGIGSLFKGDLKSEVMGTLSEKTQKKIEGLLEHFNLSTELIFKGGEQIVKGAMSFGQEFGKYGLKVFQPIRESLDPSAGVFANVGNVLSSLPKAVGVVGEEFSTLMFGDSAKDTKGIIAKVKQSWKSGLDGKNGIVGATAAMVYGAQDAMSGMSQTLSGTIYKIGDAASAIAREFAETILPDAVTVPLFGIIDTVNEVLSVFQRSIGNTFEYLIRGTEETGGRGVLEGFAGGTAGKDALAALLAPTRKLGVNIKDRFSKGGAALGAGGSPQNIGKQAFENVKNMVTSVEGAQGPSHSKMQQAAMGVGTINIKAEVVNVSGATMTQGGATVAPREEAIVGAIKEALSEFQHSQHAPSAQSSQPQQEIYDTGFATMKLDEMEGISDILDDLEDIKNTKDPDSLNDKIVKLLKKIPKIKTLAYMGVGGLVGGLPGALAYGLFRAVPPLLAGGIRMATPHIKNAGEGMIAAAKKEQENIIIREGMGADVSFLEKSLPWLKKAGGHGLLFAEKSLDTIAHYMSKGIVGGMTAIVGNSLKWMALKSLKVAGKMAWGSMKGMYNVGAGFLNRILGREEHGSGLGRNIGGAIGGILSAKQKRMPFGEAHQMEAMGYEYMDQKTQEAGAIDTARLGEGEQEPDYGSLYGLASGFSGTVDKPTILGKLLTGEKGPESVNVSPNIASISGRKYSTEASQIWLMRNEMFSGLKSIADLFAEAFNIKVTKANLIADIKSTRPRTFGGLTSIDYKKGIGIGKESKEKESGGIFDMLFGGVKDKYEQIMGLLNAKTAKALGPVLRVLGTGSVWALGIAVAGAVGWTIGSLINKNIIDPIAEKIANRIQDRRDAAKPDRFKTEARERGIRGRRDMQLGLKDRETISTVATEAATSARDAVRTSAARDEEARKMNIAATVAPVMSLGGPLGIAGGALVSNVLSRIGFGSTGAKAERKLVDALKIFSRVSPEDANELLRGLEQSAKSKPGSPADTLWGFRGRLGTMLGPIRNDLDEGGFEGDKRREIVSDILKTIDDDMPGFYNFARAMIHHYATERDSFRMRDPWRPLFEERNKITDIHELASGGIVTSPTQALIGEAGPEAVIPLDKFENILNSFYQSTTIQGEDARGMSGEAGQWWRQNRDARHKQLVWVAGVEPGSMVKGFKVDDWKHEASEKRRFFDFTGRIEDKMNSRGHQPSQSGQESGEPPPIKKVSIKNIMKNIKGGHSAANATINNLVDSYIGQPYNFGGKESALKAGNGIDCSGWTSYLKKEAYSTLGMNYSGGTYAADQIRRGVEFDPNDGVYPGDLIGVTQKTPPAFARNRYKQISHVLMIHQKGNELYATESRGKQGVITTPLSEYLKYAQKNNYSLHWVRPKGLSGIVPTRKITEYDGPSVGDDDITRLSSASTFNESAAPIISRDDIATMEVTANQAQTNAIARATGAETSNRLGKVIHGSNDNLIKQLGEQSNTLMQSTITAITGPTSVTSTSSTSGGGAGGSQMDPDIADLLAGRIS